MRHAAGNNGKSKIRRYSLPVLIDKEKKGEDQYILFSTGGCNVTQKDGVELATDGSIECEEV